MSRETRPMLNTDGQIAHLKSKGIKFEYMSEEAATDYLQQNNNYFKLRAYRKNFPKHPGGENEGKYINLDFAELKDLSIIDMRMRYTFIRMALDVEHFAKVKLLRCIEESANDGYQIVEDYFNVLQKLDKRNSEQGKESSFYNSLRNELERNRGNVYCGGIIDKYAGEYPVWAFIEIVSFGTLVHFYSFCADNLNNKDIKDDYYLLMTIKELRNAAAHSNCIIHDMGAQDQKLKPNYGLLRELNGISKTTRDRQLGNERMRQMITLLYAHKRIVTSSGVRDHAREELYTLVERMYRNIDYYCDNRNILASFDFFRKCVDILT